MQSELLSALRARHFEIRTRWAELLRVEPVTSPLGHPEALAHLIDWTLEDIFRALSTGGLRRRLSEGHVSTPNRSLCACGQNPLLSYFDAAGQSLREALINVQVNVATLDPIERDASLEELNAVLHRVARHEIEAFCGVCQHRLKSDKHADCPAMAAQAAR
jgi:hypothetical protein